MERKITFLSMTYLPKLTLITVSQDFSIMNSIPESNNSISNSKLIGKAFLIHAFLCLIGGNSFSNS